MPRATTHYLSDAVAAEHCHSRDAQAGDRARHREPGSAQKVAQGDELLLKGSPHNLATVAKLATGGGGTQRHPGICRQRGEGRR